MIKDAKTKRKIWKKPKLNILGIRLETFGADLAQTNDASLGSGS